MDIESYTCRLGTIRKLNMQNGKETFVNKDLYRLLIKDEACLLEGYESIKSNKGAITPATESSTLDGFGLERIGRLIKGLKDESWKPRPARRKYIPKPGKSEMRPLGVQGPEEKVVQAAVKRILEAIYEPRFLDCSYGFRPARGCHDALDYIDKHFDTITFIVEGDIKGMYDNVNHHRLIKLLERTIDDARFIRLIWKFLRAGYMDTGNVLLKPEVGTPQGSIISPILANIYLHELDVFMQQHVTKRIKGKSSVRTQVMKELEIKARRTWKLLRTASNEEKDKLLQDRKAVKMQILQVKPYVDPPNRVYYVRYADDFIIGVAGPKVLADSLKSRVQQFLKSDLNLDLNMEKTQVTKARQKSKPAVFLGHEIFVDTSVKLTYVNAKNRTPFLKRTTGFLIRLQAPIRRIINRLRSKGFCDGQGRPRPKDIWTTQEDWIIVRNFNYILSGLMNFYSGAHYQHRLGRVVYIMRYSCVMTLAKKHKSSIAKIFGKHGHRLAVKHKLKGKDKVESIDEPILKETARKWRKGKVIKDPYATMHVKLTKSDVLGICLICGDPSVEMHHLNHVRKGKKDTY